jgi:hypothetical protein
VGLHRTGQWQAAETVQRQLDEGGRQDELAKFVLDKEQQRAKPITFADAAERYAQAKARKRSLSEDKKTLKRLMVAQHESPSPLALPPLTLPHVEPARIFISSRPPPRITSSVVGV